MCSRNAPEPCSAPRPTAIPAPGRYRHYTGSLYTVLDIARHSETEAWLVVYRDEAGGGVWVRPLEMWFEDVGGQPRFAALPD